MPTCGDLISEASAQLHGWGSTADRITTLTSSIGPTDTTFTVDATFGQAVGITPGVVEIDSEQLYVTAIDPATGIATLAPGVGRGYKGTTATSHVAGSAIVSRPKFPRVWLFKQINEIIGSLYPMLFAVNTYSGVVTAPINQYTLPTVPMDILDVEWRDVVGNWHKCSSYNIDKFDGTLRIGGGNGWGGPQIGQPLRVLYTTQPRPFTAETDDLVTATGLPASCADVLTLGVVAKQVPGLDISRAQLNSIEQSDRSRVVPPFAGVNAAKYLMAEYQERLANEAQSLRRQYKPRLVRI